MPIFLFAVFNTQVFPISMTNPGRNDPCLCGSGKKFKRCCGGDGGKASSQVDRVQRISDSRKRDAIPVGTENAHHFFRLGVAFSAQRNFDQAIAQYRQALSLKPNFPEAHNNLGNALSAQRRLDQAIIHYEQALSLQPDFAEAHNNLGNALMALRELDRAVVHYKRALSVKPDFAEAHNSLGNALMAQRQLDQAVIHFERALSLKPEHVEAQNNLGVVRMAQVQIDQAVIHFERALSLRPHYVEAHMNLGNALSAQGQPQQAVIHYERALSLQPNYAPVHSNLLQALNYLSGQDPTAIYAAHRDFAQRHETAFSTQIATYANDRAPERRLRIGYVSSDFKQHSVGYFIEPVLAHHDRNDFEIFCYSNLIQEDKVTARLKSHVDHWRCIFGLSDAQAAEQIRTDRVDILIDLNGHTGYNRLLIFARRPAPIQIAWLGYPNTTGLSAMDYRFSDNFADPIGMTEHLHSEKLVRLPECFSCYQPPPESPEVSNLPALENQYVTFGSFNNLAKMNLEVLTVWAGILQAIPGSRLMLKNPGLGGVTVQQRIRETFVKLGVASEQLELLGRDSSEIIHLGRYRNIDIGLDPFPYNGATTTCEALWMGVPVITMAGKTHAGRVGVSQLSNLGLTELIGHTAQEYIAIAVRLAGDLGRLNQLRATLRARMVASPLTDAQRFTKNLEQAYKMMWRNWCA